ncbi:acyltransferase family protein [Luteococcus sp. Sow4_B9]|uniref:acyltransferase family protein n=1 Tax=Luteococcus sp. Sow4_B9 TaxID=3438792 RepID=UPI003F9B8344
MNSRSLWVDYAKAIGIVLVVYGHVVRGLLNAGLLKNAELHWLVDSIIYSFHMPLFFFLSGLFFHGSFRKRGTVGLLATKVDTIVYPYLVWSLLQGSIEAVLAGQTNAGASFTDVLKLWIPRQQFWFLYALFLVFCAAMLVYRRVKPKAFLAVVALGALIFLVKSAFPEHFLVGFITHNFVFFAFGVWFNEVKGFIEARAVGMMIGSGVLFVAAEYWFHRPTQNNSADGGLASLCMAVLGIVFTVSTCMVLARRPVQWMLTIGTLSMPIFLMHILCSSGSRIILSKALGIDDGLLHIITGCALGILVPIIVTTFLQARGITGLFEAPPALSLARRLQPRVGAPGAGVHPPTPPVPAC